MKRREKVKNEEIRKTGSNAQNDSVMSKANINLLLREHQVNKHKERKNHYAESLKYRSQFTFNSIHDEKSIISLFVVQAN